MYHGAICVYPNPTHGIISEEAMGDVTSARDKSMTLQSLGTEGSLLPCFSHVRVCCFVFAMSTSKVSYQSHVFIAVG